MPPWRLHEAFREPLIASAAAVRPWAQDGAKKCAAGADFSPLAGIVNRLVVTRVYSDNCDVSL
jgi:hypothetical protein